VKGMVDISHNSKIILEQRYLLKDENGKIVETPEDMLHRVAKVMASIDLLYGKSVEETKSLEEQFYTMMDNLEFLPNTPTLMNAGTKVGQLSACFCLLIEDSMESIFGTLHDAAMIFKSGGGVGFDFSKLRPKDDAVSTTGGTSSGPLSFMKVYNAMIGVVKSGGKRRGAAMGGMRCDHPDIGDFIYSKMDEFNNDLENFNLSVAITDKFMEALEKDEKYELINPHTKQSIGKVSARIIWEHLCALSWLNGEPAMIFIDAMNKANPTPQIGSFEITNPCLTGDTLIAVADGRNYVSIKQLAEEGKDIPVYTWSGNDMTIRMGRNPRLTQHNTEIIKLNFTDGSSLKVTKNHRIMLRDGTYKEANQLLIGERIMPFYKIQYSQSNNKSKYWCVHQNKGILHKGEHKLIAEYMLGRPLDNNEVVHHIDFNSLNNSWNNLNVISEQLHNQIHTELMFGNNNPYHRFPSIKETLSKPRYGKENGMYGKHHSKETKEKISVKAKGKRHSPITEFKKGLIPKNKGIKTAWITTICPVCNNEMTYIKSNPIKTCSIGCHNTYRMWERKGIELNHIITSIEEIGQEDVYNLTVDDFHNYAVITKDYISEKGNRKLGGIIISNCGELPLLSYESCNLGSINLGKFVKYGKIEWDRLAEVVKLSVRFLDNVIDANKYPLSKIEEITKANRKIGLGVMGWADMLIKLGCKYDSEEAVETADFVMGFIEHKAKETSQELGKEKGNFPNFEKSIFVGEEYIIDPPYMRNATVTSIAPTGTISIIADASSGIEPVFSIISQRNVKDGFGKNLLEINPAAKEILKKQGKWAEFKKQLAESTCSKCIIIPQDIKEMIPTASQISPEWHVKMQAAFQKWVDNSISKTVNLPNSASVEDVMNVYILAYKSGCKGITVYRDGSRKFQLLEGGDGSCPTCPT
jgi:ribonucleoside-diphosphate reductase alpha chain